MNNTKKKRWKIYKRTSEQWGKQYNYLYLQAKSHLYWKYSAVLGLEFSEGKHTFFQLLPLKHWNGNKLTHDHLHASNWPTDKSIIDGNVLL